MRVASSDLYAYLFRQPLPACAAPAALAGSDHSTRRHRIYSSVAFVSLTIERTLTSKHLVVKKLFSFAARLEHTSRHRNHAPKIG